MMFFLIALAFYALPIVAQRIANHAARTGLRYVAGSYQRYYWMSFARQWNAVVLKAAIIRPYMPWLLLAGLLSILLT